MTSRIRLLLSGTVIYCSTGLRGWVGVRVGLESKAEGRWFQAGDLSRWELTTMSKTSVFQVSRFFFYSIRGYTQILFIVCVVVQNILVNI
jgi:hypothetical protein